MSSSVEEEDEGNLTRKQRREQARAERKAIEEEHAASATRRTRLAWLGGALAIVVVVVVVILVATGGSSSAPAPKPGTETSNKTVAEVEKLVGGIPQSANVLGNPNAPVTLQYFGDLECPICKEFTLGAFPSIIQQWVRSGKLKVEYRSLETATREPEVFKTQQVAALAAGKQKKMWQFVELFYHEQGEEDSGYVTESYLQNLAEQVPGLDLTKWSSDRNDPNYTNQVEADAQAANNAGFTGTPSFLVGKSGQTLSKLSYSSLTDPTAFNEAFEKALKS
jgi:protein-disulfide isomerase